MKRHAELAEDFLKDKEKALWHNDSVWSVRKKRDQLALEIKDFEGLKDLASEIKLHTLTHLDEYLEAFEKNALARGIKVHWAKDAKECNEIVYDIARKNGAKNVIKSKSMLSEEVHLNHYLEKKGLEVVETDLGERIIQFEKQTPSHIVLPAIHLKREEVGSIFHKNIGTPKGNGNPTFLTHAARAHLREKFLGADVGISGVNYGVAETGEIVVCTNEGNADLTMGLPKVHIALMGIEKVVPKLEHLSVFTTLLARSATGQPSTVYTTHIAAPRKGGEMHVVLVDNDRSKFLGDERLYEALKCIRCGACLNTCPVYRYSGGHSYNYIIPGPIGSALAPFRSYKNYNDMAFACSLCASCSGVCPVKIPLDRLLFHHRQSAVQEKAVSKLEKLMFGFVSFSMLHPSMWGLLNKSALFFMRLVPMKLINLFSMGWGKYRDLPNVDKSFSELIKERKEKR